MEIDTDGTVLALIGEYDSREAPRRSAANRNRGRWEPVRLDRTLEEVLDRYPFTLGMFLGQLVPALDGTVYLTGGADAEALQPVRHMEAGAALTADGGVAFARIDPRGRRVLLATYVGSSGGSALMAARLMPGGSLLCYGEADGTDFPMVEPIQDRLNLTANVETLTLYPRDLILFKVRDETLGESLPRLTLSSRELRFRASLRPEGAIAPGRPPSAPTQTVWLGNGGQVPLRVSVSGAFPLEGRQGGPFEVISGGGTTVIPPRGRAKVVVRFSPGRSGPHRGVLVLASTDPTRGVYRMPLLGTATR